MKTILLVEDDAAIRHVFSVAFAGDQYRVIAYESGVPVMNNEVVRPDLFIVDKNVSGINGLELCAFIKQHKSYQQTPVLMISASPGLDQHAKEAGADAALSKPFTLKALRAAISKALHPSSAPGG